MMRLVRRGLMFGNLTEVMSAALVGRYNRALEHLSGKTTALTEFHIDISGFSPEIAEELGDPLYLNPHGCNRQFILLTPDQKSAPLLESKFSFERTILQDYITENERELFALTAREAVAGELLNSVFQISTPSDLFAINQIDIEADTIGEHVAEAAVLQKQIDDFMFRDDAWWDDVLIAQMIEIAKRTGNIQRNPISLSAKTYSQDNFYTSHFGGLYVFRGAKPSTVIASKAVAGLDALPVDQVITFQERGRMAKFLFDNHLAEPIVTTRDEALAAIIKQKIDFITISVAADAGEALGDISKRQVRQLGRKYASQMPPIYHGLMQIWRWASMGGSAPDLDSSDEAFFYALRSSQHHDRDLVNMMLANLSPMDFRQLFICHKDAFYEAYRDYSEAKKEYVSQFLEEEYAMDKAGARRALFGNEIGMGDEMGMEAAPPPPSGYVRVRP